jgi:hypothetical protein
MAEPYKNKTEKEFESDKKFEIKAKIPFWKIKKTFRKIFKRKKDKKR